MVSGRFRWLSVVDRFVSFLTLVSTQIENTEMKIVKCGAPQCSIIGPLLFLIFVNDLNNATKVLDPVLFADNANLFCSDNNIRTPL